MYNYIFGETTPRRAVCLLADAMLNCASARESYTVEIRSVGRTKATVPVAIAKNPTNVGDVTKIPIIAIVHNPAITFKVNETRRY